MQISHHKHVTCDFSLSAADGTLISHSTKDDQMTYIHGREEILPGLEAALEGKSKGDRVSVTLTPEEAFGTRDDALIHEVPRDRFPPEVDLEVGVVVTAKGPEGEIPMHVVLVTPEVVTVDENHPLAGVTLHFEVAICEVRDATAGELTEV